MEFVNRETLVLVTHEWENPVIPRKVPLLRGTRDWCICPGGRFCQQAGDEGSGWVDGVGAGGGM